MLVQNLTSLLFNRPQRAARQPVRFGQTQKEEPVFTVKIVVPKPGNPLNELFRLPPEDVEVIQVPARRLSRLA